METAQLPLCLPLNPLLYLKLSSHFKLPDSFLSNHQLNSGPYAPSNEVGMLIFSEGRRKQDKYRHEVRRKRKIDEPLDAAAKAMWQENAEAVKHCTASVSTMTARIAHTDSSWVYIVCAGSQCVTTALVWTARQALEWTWYHDNPLQFRLLSWRYENLPRTCENRHQTRTNKPQRKFFPHRRNWVKKRSKKEKWSEQNRRAAEVLTGEGGGSNTRPRVCFACNCLPPTEQVSNTSYWLGLAGERRSWHCKTSPSREGTHTKRPW